MVTPTEAKVVKSFYNQKLNFHNFSGQDLVDADFRKASLIGCNFNDADLSYTNFEGANLRHATLVRSRCFRTNFKDACLMDVDFSPKDAFGVTFSFDCNTFTGLKFSEMWWHMILMSLLLSKPPKENMDLDLIKAIGPERYAGLHQIVHRNL